jgi:two-component system, sensor histidine kinase RegB
LATIQVTAKELARSLPEGSLDHDDAQLVLAQAQRCREILRKLGDNQALSDPILEHVSLGQLLHEAAARHAILPNKALLFGMQPPREEPDLMVSRQAAILYGLGNLIENALEFAASKVTIYAKWDQVQVHITISDDGPGFDEAVMERLGEPYVTTRGVGTSTPRLREGLGLGFFIAKTLLERSGGKVTFRNRVGNLQGASVIVIWPRTALEVL